MLPRHAISDAGWDRVRHLLPGQPGQHRRVARGNRLFLDAVLWVAKAGAPWRDPPDRLGNRNSVYRRFARWARKGVWARVLAALADPDVGWLILDSAIVRPHPHAAGARKNRAGRAGRAGRRTRRRAAPGAGSGPRSTGR